MTVRKSDRRSYRPGRGEFAPLNGPHAALSNLRDRFMVAAFKIEPELEASLRTLYDAHLCGNETWLTPSSDISIALVADPKAQVPDLDLTPPSPSAIRFARDQLKPWAERWRLGHPWCVDWTIEKKLLLWWALARHADGFVTNLWCGPQPIKRIPFTFAMEGWIATEETVSTTLICEPGITRADFESMARKRFECELARYCDHVEREAEAAGYVRMKTLRQPEHWRWLTAYQVCLFSYNGLAAALGVTRHAVEHPVQSRALEIGLSLRNPKLNKRASVEQIRAILTATSPDQTK
jgi:hypothetical protein